MNKEQLEKLNNKLITRLPDCDLQEIENFIKAQRKEIIEQIKNGKICLNCGRPKKNNLSDWCVSCLENE